MSNRNPDSVDKHVGSRVRLRRMMLGMSQEKLGESLGVTFQQVQKYEKGTNRIGASRLQHIAIVLKVPVEFFFEGQEGSNQSDTPVFDLASASNNGLKLLKKNNNLSPNGQKLLLQIAAVIEESVLGPGTA